MSDQELLLSSGPPSRTQVRTVVIVGLLLSVAFLIALPFHDYPLARSYPYVILVFTILTLGDALTATLLFSQAAVIRSRGLIALATGYVFSALILIPRALSYLHAFSEKGSLSADPSASVWLHLPRRAGLPIAVIIYAALKATDGTRPIRHEQVRSTIMLSMAGSLLGVMLLTILAIVGAPMLPPLMTDSFTWMFPRMAWLVSVPLALTVGAMVAVSRKDRSVLDLWLLLVLWSSVTDLVLTLITTSRFTVGWYVGSVVTAFSGVFILGLLLWESNRLYARLAVLVTAQRREREGRLLTMNAVAASMAHEIKQPLATIVFNAEDGRAALQQAPADIKEGSELFQVIEQNARRAGQVVESIRATVAARSSEKVSLDINELIREAIALVAGELMAWRVRLDLTLDEQTPLVSVDRVQMKHVFLNLMMNAIEAMTAVADRPRILAIRSTSNNAGVLVTLQDSGVGIDPSQSKRIFEPFFTTKPEGTGMGLALSRSIIEAHGGHIRLSTDQPFGATFNVQLPRPAP